MQDPQSISLVKQKKNDLCDKAHTAVCLSNRHSTQYRLQAVQQVRRESEGYLDFKSLFGHRPLIAMANLVAATISMNKNYVFFYKFQKFYFYFSIFGLISHPWRQDTMGAFKSTELPSLHLIFFGSQFFYQKKSKKALFHPPLLSLTFP